MEKQVSIVILNHGRLGQELIASAEMIIGEISNIQAVSLLPGMSIEEFYKAADRVILPLKGEIVILTDLFGGTPCNVAMMLQQKYNVRILCGMNLPMLIDLVNTIDMGGYENMDELIGQVLETAQTGIYEPPAYEAEEEEREVKIRWQKLN
ncbi:MAG TPA: hypothetical protein H9909_08260 [Candidatus Mediterraneibacter norfolkensis]|nr:hypothetical protein [Candidatus Mediterraneibacter norfolkensis]